MSKITNISWTHHTYNPWIGCTKVSPGCEQCYAKNDQCDRKKVVKWGPSADRKRVSADTLADPHEWNATAARTGIRTRVFCSSLADVFDQHASIEPAWKAALWQTIRDTPNLNWLLLTKRPEAVARDLAEFVGNDIPENVWFGFSAENQAYFDKRWAFVEPLRFRIKFVSYEPALGPIRLNESHRGNLSWVIFGGETSLRRSVSRPANPDWARTMRDDCHRLDIPYWYKQSGNWLGDTWVGKTSARYRNEHDKLDGQVIHQVPC